MEMLENIQQIKRDILGVLQLLLQEVYKLTCDS